MAKQQQKGPFIVLRLLQDGDKGGNDIRAYIKVDKPFPGEKIYHGDFVKRTIEVADNGPMGSEYREVYEPVGELTSELYGGQGGAVETF